MSGTWPQGARASLALALGFGLGLAAAGLPGTSALRAAGMRQAEPDLAGLVLQFEDGTVVERCVALGGEERTGLELLDLAGLDIDAEVSAIGSLVCRIEGTGCAFPGEACWCQCRDLGADCRYWAYHILEGDRWVYASIGAAARRLRHGDVDGWAWGPGNVSGGALPPLRRFEQICAARLAPVPTSPPPSAAPPPTLPGPSSPTERPRSDPRATSRPRPTTRGEARGATASPEGPASPVRAATPGTASAPDASAAAAKAAGATAAAAATGLAERRATLAAYPTVLASLLAGPTAASRSGAESDPGEASAPDAASADPQGATPAAAPPRTGGLAEARPVGEGASADPAESADQAESAAAASPAGGDGAAGGGWSGYLTFALVLLVLGSALVLLRNRRLA